MAKIVITLEDQPEHERVAIEVRAAPEFDANREHWTPAQNIAGQIVSVLNEMMTADGSEGGLDS